MVALLIGLVLIAFCVFACLPAGVGLGWTEDILLFLRGFAPVFAAFVGLIAVLIGFADLKDKKEAKKEEAEAKAAEKRANAQ